MPIHKLKLVSKRQVAALTLLFKFTKPPGFQFKPGQYGGFTLINPPTIDEQGLTRRFSLLSTPSDPEIAIVTRLQNSAYKQALNQLSIDSEIKFAGPLGAFTLHENASIPAVFIAGGIGIAPFYSMLYDTLLRDSSRQLFLFYGNQSFQDAAFLTELFALQKKYPTFKLIPTLAYADQDWQGELGFITDQLIKKYVLDIHLPIYYVCGSPVMVTTLQEALAEMGIHEDQVKTEDFPGY